MNIKELLEKLENYLKRVEVNATELYKIRLRGTIAKLKQGNYTDEEIITDLQSLGFHEEAKEMKKSLYV